MVNKNLSAKKSTKLLKCENNYMVASLFPLFYSVGMGWSDASVKSTSLGLLCAPLAVSFLPSSL